MNEQNLYEVQRQLEQEAVELGIKRYREAAADDLSSAQPGIALMRRTIGPVSERVAQFTARVEKGMPAKLASTAYFMAQFEPDVVAYIAVRKIIGGLAKRVPLSRLASSIGMVLEDAVNFRTLQREAPGLYKQLQRRIASRKNAKVRHLVLRRQAKYAGIKTVEWNQAERLKLGLKLVSFVIAATDLIRLVRITVRKNDTPLYVVASPGTMTWLEQAHNRCELLSPTYLPMVVPPKAWTTPFNGGYLEQRTTLLKSSNTAYLDELRQAEMPAVYSAINALQNTRWRISRGILAALKSVWDSGQSLGGLPSRDSLSLPTPPQADFDTPKEARTEEQRERIKAWKKIANGVYSENMRLESKRLSLTQKLWIAEKFEQYEAIYFPHVMDWRGRAYPVPAALSPQGDDAAKAMLEFADGKPLGDNGAYWLAVHGANCFGVDKVCFEERTKWVSEHTDEIIACAMDPLANREWTEADAPWQFLAFCKEWAGLTMWINAGNLHQDYVSHLPVGLDGSCNGLQNFSAMLLDEIGGRATNLVPSASPSDIYAEVAKVSQGIVEFDAGNGDEIAKLWLGKIDRKVTKRNAMTLAYGATAFGFRGQLLGTMQEYADEHGEELIAGESKYKAAVYLARVNYESIGRVVVAARQAMDWLIAASRIAAQDSLPISWTTPTGLTVLQNYREYSGEVVAGEIAGERVRLIYSIESDRLNKRKQAQGIAPNFVHSMDASHMMATVNACRERGVTHFSMVHDSYGVHASDVDVLAHELRRAFVEQYSRDVLGAFRQQLINQLPPKLAEKIPPLPPMGSLDLTAVLDSEYFFA
jgi:DNA-directed RNA polymerase